MRMRRVVPYGRLKDFVGKKIRFFGKIKEVVDDALILQTAEGVLGLFLLAEARTLRSCALFLRAGWPSRRGVVLGKEVRCTNHGELPQSKFVEVTAVVAEDLSLSQEPGDRMLALGNDIGEREPCLRSACTADVRPKALPSRQSLQSRNSEMRVCRPSSS